METFEVYGNFGKLITTIEAESYEEAYEEAVATYTTPVLVIPA